MNIKPIDRHDEIHEPIDEDFGSGSLLYFFELHDLIGLDGSEMEIEELFEFRPQQHIYLAEVGIQSGATFFAKDFAVAIVDGQNQQHCEDVESGGYGMLEMLQKQLDAWSE